MIETTKSYKVGDKIFATIAEAQSEALKHLLCPNCTPTDVESNLILNVVSKAGSVVEILLMNNAKQSTRKPRSDRGKKHKPQTVDEVRRIPEVATPGVKVEGSGKYAGK